MLELYQAYADYRDFMVLVEQLVSGLASELLSTTCLSYQGRALDLTPPWRRATMAELVTEATGEEASVHTAADDLRRRVAAAGVDPDPSWGPGKLLLELYEKTAETGLWGPVFVTDFPAEVSPLARRHRDDPDLVERFEAVVAGRELVNAFSELVDPDDQRARFEAQAAVRAAGDEEAMRRGRGLPPGPGARPPTDGRPGHRGRPSRHAPGRRGQHPGDHRLPHPAARTLTAPGRPGGRRRARCGGPGIATVALLGLRWADFVVP